MKSLFLEIIPHTGIQIRRNNAFVCMVSTFLIHAVVSTVQSFAQYQFRFLPGRHTFQNSFSSNIDNGYISSDKTEKEVVYHMAHKRNYFDAFVQKIHLSG